MNSADIEQLIARKMETRNVDFKEGFKWSKENRDLQLDLLKDMMAMANTRDGGTLILGVVDRDYTVIGVDQEVSDSFDVTSVAQMLHENASPKITLNVLKIQVEGKQIVAIDIAEFEDVPIVCADTRKDARGVRTILRKSALYIRTSAARTEEVSSDEEMRELLGRAITKKGDQLLKSIEQLLQGKAPAPAAPALDLYAEELHQADAWFRDKLQKGFLASPRWEFSIHPTEYRSPRMPIVGLENTLNRCAVRLRGWPFPYLGNKSETSNFNKGFQGYYDSPDLREAFRFYQSQLFVFKRALWEDLRHAGPPDKRTLSFISAIYSITEWLLFSQRLAENSEEVKSFRISVRLIGAKDRSLASYEASVPLMPCYKSEEPDIHYEKDISNANLRATPLDIAKEFVKHLFTVFNWTENTDAVIHGWQQKLLRLMQH